MYLKNVVPSALLALVASLVMSGCGGSSAKPSVTVTPSTATVNATDTVSLAATVANDKNSGGVTWTVSGGGTVTNSTTSATTRAGHARGHNRRT